MNMHVSRMAPVRVPVVPIPEAARLLITRHPVTSFPVTKLDRSDMEHAWQGMKRFEEEVPPEEQLRYAIEAYRLGSGEKRGLNSDGIVRRNVTDRKVYLHWRPDTTTLLWVMRRIRLNHWQHEWFQACERIHSACLGAYRELVVEMDKIRPEYRLLDRLEAATHHGIHVLRVLYYPPRSGELADKHVDWSPFTLHAGESKHGLYGIESGNKVYYDTPEHPNVLSFAGEQLAKITSNDIPALYHGVEDMTDGSEPRWAIVFFGKMVHFEDLY